MELVNELYAFCDREQITGASETPVRPAAAAVTKEALEALVLLLSPFTPHLSEELWEALGHTDGVVAAGWPDVRSRRRPCLAGRRSRSRSTGGCGPG